MEKRSISYPLTSEDIYKALKNKVKIINYNMLKNYKNIESLLYPHDKVMILYETQKNHGHWTCLMRRMNGDIDFFDPYGFMPDDQRDYIPDEMWEDNYLSQLLADYKGGKVYYNEDPLQTMTKNVATCGRWCILRLLYPHLSLEQFQNLFANIPPQSRDAYVTSSTNHLL